MSAESERERLDAGERAELEQLRAEVAALRGQVGRGAASGPARAARSGLPRTVLSTLLLVLGCVLLAPATVAVWLDSVVTDTDRYVATVGPLADDAAIQAAVTNRATEEIVAAIDVEALVADVSAALVERGLGPRLTTAVQGLAAPLASGVESWLHDQVAVVVASDRFADLWTQAHRAVHERVVAALTGTGDSGALEISGDTVSVQLAPLIEAVKQRLVDAGVGLAERIPPVDAEFVLVQGEGVETAQRAFGLIDRLGSWLPILAVAVLVASVLVTSDRRRAAIRVGLGAVVAMLALGIVLVFSRAAYLGALPPAADQAAAAAVFDQVVTFLRTTLRAVLVVGLVVAVVAYVAGPSRQAVAARRSLRGLGAALDRRGWRDNATATWLGAHKRAVQTGVVIVAALVIVFWDYPTGGVVLTVALVSAVLAVIVEVVAAPEVGRVG